jgi:endonuclease YncB( thermonuclease family)
VVLLAPTTSLTITGAVIGDAATLQSTAEVTGFSVTDTAANVLANLATLAVDGKLSSFSLSGATTLAVIGTQYLANTVTLDKLATGDTLTVSAANVAGAPSLQADTHVGSFAIIDTAANVGNALASLGHDTKLSAIALTGGTSLTVTYAEYMADTATLATGDTMTVTGVPATAAPTVAANTHVKTLTVSDTLADIGTSIGSLATAAAGG